MKRMQNTKESKMFKKIFWFKSYPHGLRTECLFGKLNIGFNNNLTHRNFPHIIKGLESILDELKNSGHFKTIKIESHLLIDRKLLKQLKNPCMTLNVDNLIKEKYLQILRDKGYNFKYSTIKISTFHKYLFFFPMKIGLYLKNFWACNYTKPMTFRIPDTNYMGRITIFI